MAVPELDTVLDITGLLGTFLLLAVSLLIVYPIVAYARNVAYTEAFVLLATGFFVLTVIGILEIVFAMDAAADVLRPVAAAAALAGTWFFAREFVDVGGDDWIEMEAMEGGDDDDDG